MIPSRWKSKVLHISSYFEHLPINHIWITSRKKKYLNFSEIEIPVKKWFKKLHRALNVVVIAKETMWIMNNFTWRVENNRNKSIKESIKYRDLAKRMYWNVFDLICLFSFPSSVYILQQHVLIWQHIKNFTIIYLQIQNILCKLNYADIE